MLLRSARRHAAVVLLPFAALLPLDAAFALQLSETLSWNAPTLQASAPTAELAATAVLGTGFDTGSDFEGREVDGPALRLITATALHEAEAGGKASRVVGAALAMLGTAYRFGRDSLDGLDCSALMRRVFGSAGETLPRTAREMLASGTAVDHAAVQKGDLLFYRWQRRQLHVAVYIDDNTIVHASPKAGRVVITELTPGWRRHLVAVRRLI